MTADLARELFSDYLENTLDAPTRDELQSFLSEHPEAAAELIAFERTLTLMQRLPPMEPTIDMWRELLPRVLEHQTEMRLPLGARVRVNWGRMLSRVSEGAILFTRGIANRTQVRLNRYLIGETAPNTTEPSRETQ